MKTITFYRENNKFDDILNDNVLKKHFSKKIGWYQHLTIDVHDEDDKGILTYINIKYGESIKELTKDYSPIMYVDYVPIKPKACE